MDPDCPVCRSNSGEERISPAPPIHETDLWVVEHAYPTSLVAWIVIVLKRHADALHELTRAEGEELGLLQWAVCRALELETECVKEYAVFFAEVPEFNHVHVHIVPRAADLPPELRGGRVFAFLKTRPEDAISPEAVVEVCERLGHEVRRQLRDEAHYA